MPSTIRKTVLDNGVRIVTESVDDLRSTALSIWVDVGSRDEGPEEQGICHFIEHMMFKGTERLSAREIAERIDAIGGQLNAFTTKEQTCYYARVLGEHVPEAVDLLADMLLGSRMDPADVAKEQGVIVEEIGMYEDTPDELIHDLAARAYLGRHPAGRAVLGTRESVQALTRERLQAFVRRHYTGRRLVVAAAGKVDHDELVERIACHFGGLAAGEAPQRGAPVQADYRWLVRSRKTEQAHLCLTAPGLRANSPDKWTMLILDTVLGGGVSSRLFQELREERGWVYSTYSYHTAFADAGYFTVYAGASPDRAPAVLELVEQQLAALAASGITEAELRRAQEHLKGSILLSMESMSYRANRLARAELSGEPYLAPDELIARIESVRCEQVHRLAARLFVPDAYAYAAVGPVPWKTRRRLAAAG
ncbi:M16 family metallopeptidase [Geochorda subterranea]|uniref:Pitrilysin family protein n=1 Tax=Geochorda subterranea TaxID=3109564 RepID=A0ABZ1BLP2_9FIRM|nr:pitrilysin family protein [Limnochorda sp. LNt]WRP13438.1 pitrilysin family protein [Limnochorda sp. LNt]